MKAPEFWSVPREWAGETAFVIAGGPSVTQGDVDKLRGRRVVVVNKSYEKAPWAEYFFTHDPKDWPGHKAGLAAVGFRGRRVTCHRGIVVGEVLKLDKRDPARGIAVEPTAIAMKRTSTSGGLNLAFHLVGPGGRIALLGADMQAAPDGRTHHHSPYPYPPRPDCWDRHIEELRVNAASLAKLGVTVINCSMVSRISFWTKMTVDEVIQMTDARCQRTEGAGAAAA